MLSPKVYFFVVHDIHFNQPSIYKLWSESVIKLIRHQYLNFLIHKSPTFCSLFTIMVLTHTHIYFFSGVHQGSSLSPLLFIIIINVLYSCLTNQKLLFVDDLLVPILKNWELRLINNKLIFLSS